MNNDRVICIGGYDATQNYCDVFSMTLNQSALIFETLNVFLSLDLSDPNGHWKTHAPCPPHGPSSSVLRLLPSVLLNFRFE